MKIMKKKLVYFLNGLCYLFLTTAFTCMEPFDDYYDWRREEEKIEKDLSGQLYSDSDRARDDRYYRQILLDRDLWTRRIHSTACLDGQLYQPSFWRGVEYWEMIPVFYKLLCLSLPKFCD